MKDIKIYATQGIDRDYAHFENSLILPIRGGAVFDTRNVDILGDNTGDNISEKNGAYCELTTQYWAWKNVDADYYGFFHYRRYLSFGEDMPGVETFITCDSLDADAKRELALDELIMHETIEMHDIILPHPQKFSEVRNQSVCELSVYDQFKKSSPYLNIKDLDCVMNIISERYPAFIEDVHTYIQGSLFYPCNIFIMKKVVFYDYSKWLFDILAEFEARIDMSTYSKESYRTTGHLAERLLGIYITNLLRTKDYKICHLQCGFFNNTNPEIVLNPIFKDNNIPIVLSANDYFSPYLGVCIKSLVKYTSIKNNYDVIVLTRDISIVNQMRLMQLVLNHKNVSLRFYDVSNIIKKFKLKSNGHMSIESYFRLLTLDVLKGYDKTLYVDADTIIKSDLSELFSIDLGDKLLGATIDACFLGQLNNVDGEFKEYSTNNLGLKNPYEYFQSGVMAMNIKAMRNEFSTEELLRLAEANDFRYLDQDILNIKCQGRVKTIDMAWNLLTDCMKVRFDIIKQAPLKIYQEYAQARICPRIIHFAGCVKPWQDPGEDMADEFWEIARTTVFYEEILYRMNEMNYEERLDRANEIATLLNARIQAIISNLERSFPRKVADKVLPQGTKLRKVVKKVYYLFKH